MNTSGKIKVIFRLLIAQCVLLPALLFGPFFPSGYVHAGDLADGNPFGMTMLDVGQGLSLVVEADGQYMIYDGGGRESSSYVVSWTIQHSIDKFQYMVASHYDEDHIAGLIGLLKTTSVDTLLCPDYATDSKIYDSFIRSVRESAAVEEHPEAGDIYQLGNAQIEVLSDDPTAEQENDRSLAVRVTYGDFSMIITGDASETEEDTILSRSFDLGSDLYVAGHHGSSYSGSSEFLDQIIPAYTFISCGEGNSYGHPAADALDRIKASGSQIFRTDRQGEVTVYSDGSQYWFSQDPCDDWTPGTVPEEEADGETGWADTVTAGSSAEGAAAGDGSSAQDSGDPSLPSGGYYILNTSSRLIHLPDCDSVKQMKPKNMAESTKSKEDLIAEGYRPCKNCNP